MCVLVVVWSWWVKVRSDGQWMVGGGWWVVVKGGWVGGWGVSGWPYSNLSLNFGHQIVFIHTLNLTVNSLFSYFVIFHIFDPLKALQKCLGGLRSSGTVLIADNVAFGLLRSRKQKIRAEAGPAEFEHWRNDRGKDVDTLLNDLKVEVIMSRDVSAQTSNQWIRQVRVKKS